MYVYINKVLVAKVLNQKFYDFLCSELINNINIENNKFVCSDKILEDSSYNFIIPLFIFLWVSYKCFHDWYVYR